MQEIFSVPGQLQSIDNGVSPPFQISFMIYFNYCQGLGLRYVRIRYAQWVIYKREVKLS